MTVSPVHKSLLNVVKMNGHVMMVNVLMQIGYVMVNMLTE